MRGSLLVGLLLGLAGCGAKSAPSGELPCVSGPIKADGNRAQVILVIDRSNSMKQGLPGLPAGTSRWQLLQSVLGATLGTQDIDLGAKFFPATPAAAVAAAAGEVCEVASPIDVLPVAANIQSVLNVFRTTSPYGGTPTASALRSVAAFLGGATVSNGPKHVVLVTDGGPNCGESTGANGCICTGPATSCPLTGSTNCLDHQATLDAIATISQSLAIPVHVVGIEDPTRPDLSDVLDSMAIAGGRPNAVGPGRRFHNALDADALGRAFLAIADAVASCTIQLEPFATRFSGLSVSIGNVQVPRDESRQDGWSLTSRGRYEISLFGGACQMASELGARVEVSATCGDPRP